MLWETNVNKYATYRFVDGDKIAYPWVTGDDGLTCAAQLAIRHDGGFIERGKAIGDGDVVAPTAIATFFDNIGFWVHPGTCSGREYQIIEAIQDQGYLQGTICKSAITLDYPGIRDLLTIAANAVAVVGDFTLAVA